MKFLYKAGSFNEKQRIVKLFEENSVKYKVRIAGPNLLSERDPNKTYWFRIYVDKKDFEKAGRLLGLNM